MRFAIKSPEGQFINIVRREQEDFAPMFDFNAMFPIFYPCDKPSGVFYLKHDLYMAAMHIGLKGYEKIKDFRLYDETGTTYVLSWVNRKVSDMAIVSVPIKEIIKRDLPDTLIPALWKDNRQLYIDHFAIKMHPFDYCIWQFSESGYDITQLQSINLNGVDYAVKRYISNQDETLRFLNQKVKDAIESTDPGDMHNTASLIIPLVFDTIEKILVDHNVTEVLKRFYQAKKRIIKLINKK